MKYILAVFTTISFVQGSISLDNSDILIKMEQSKSDIPVSESLTGRSLLEAILRSEQSQEEALDEEANRLFQRKGDDVSENVPPDDRRGSKQTGDGAWKHEEEEEQADNLETVYAPENFRRGPDHVGAVAWLDGEDHRDHVEEPRERDRNEPSAGGNKEDSTWKHKITYQLRGSRTIATE